MSLAISSIGLAFVCHEIFLNVLIVCVVHVFVSTVAEESGDV